MTPEREAVEAAAARRCAESAVQLLEVQFMAVLLKAINSPNILAKREGRHGTSKPNPRPLL